MAYNKNKLTHDESEKSIEAIEEAIKYFGSQRKLAKEIGISNQNISLMKLGRRVIPIHHAIAIENITKGYVKKSNLRPDVF